MKFTDYCQTKNIKVLREDLKFIRASLNYFPLNEHKTLLKTYTEKWLLGMSIEEKESLKQTSGRRMANKWLLELTLK